MCSKLQLLVTRLISAAENVSVSIGPLSRARLLTLNLQHRLTRRAANGGRPIGAPLLTEKDAFFCAHLSVQPFFKGIKRTC